MYLDEAVQIDPNINTDIVMCSLCNGRFKEYIKKKWDLNTDTVLVLYYLHYLI